MLEPEIADTDFTLYCGEAETVLRNEVTTGWVSTCVTSPPYWKLRDYGHDDQLGSERTPEEYIERLVSIMREVKRVLHSTGTLWLNVGDTYIDKELAGIPWRAALALKADGWRLRSEIVWWKPDAMPESVTDRPGRDHEHLFMFSKERKSYYDIEAERVPHKTDNRRKTTVQQGAGSVQHRDGERWPNGGRNIRTVWEITTENNAQAHFAVFPKELVRRCVSLGSSEKGVCPVCYAPWVRVVESDGESVAERQARQPERWTSGAGIAPRSDGGKLQQGVKVGRDVERRTVGWERTCEHEWRPSEHGAGDVPECPIPATILDPFMGSGTTAFVARENGRASLGVELVPDYCEIIRQKTKQLSLLAQ